MLGIERMEMRRGMVFPMHLNKNSKEIAYRRHDKNLAHAPIKTKKNPLLQTWHDFRITPRKGYPMPLTSTDLAQFERQLHAAVPAGKPGAAIQQNNSAPKASFAETLGALAEEQLNIAPAATTTAPAKGQKDSKLTPEKLREIDKKAKEFEAMAIGQLLQPMFETVETNGLFGGGIGEEHYRSFLVNEYGKMLATENGGLGIAKHVRDHMIKMMEA
jgi:flagellar protein FlgJ